MTNRIWHIELLGSLRLIQADRTITRFRTQKTAALLAYLALHIESPHPRETLISLLWPDEAIEAGRNGLRVALNSLRKQLEPIGTPYRGVLFADRNQIQLNPDACSTDVSMFMKLLRSDRESKQPPTAESVAEAVTLYRGDLLPGFYDDWVTLERERLSQIHQRSLLGLARTFLDRKNYDLALDYANRVVQIDPFAEEAYRILILAHGNLGNLSAARHWYELLTATFAAELGSRPSAETTAAMDSFVATSSPTPREAQPALSAPVTLSTPQPKLEALPVEPPHADQHGVLPYPFTRFFGREDESALIHSLLGHEGTDAIRVLTLTGPGGTGKTRLAVEAARSLLGVYDGSVLFVPLSDVTSTARIAEAIAIAAGLPRSVTGEYWDAVVARLGESPTLVILDGFEHLTAEGGTVVLALRKSAPSTRLLITSRRRLEIPGERELSVPTLPIPATTDSADKLKASPSVRLFLDRAQAVTSDFAVTSRNSDDLGAVCRALEGIPLALELAAARTRSVSLREMKEQLTEPTLTANRFHLLTSRRADKPDRHRSLWAAIAWSVELLPPPLRQFFFRLSVFSGGWTLDAAQSICDEPYAREYLTQLRSHSLVQSDEDAFPDQRFRMLDSLREFASEQLTPHEQDEVAERHIDYFLGLADEARQRLRGSDQGTWLKRVDGEYGNLRSAIQCCVAHCESAGEAGLRFASSLGQYWQLHGPLRESACLVADLLSRTEYLERNIHRAGALNTVGGLCLRLGDYSAARAYFEEGLPIYRLLGDAAGTGRMLMNQGYLSWVEGDLPASYAARRESLDIFLEIGDRWQAAAAHLNLGSVERDMGDNLAATASFEQSLDISREIGDLRGAGSALLNLANMAYSTGDFARARTWYEESLAITREQENPLGISLALSNIGALLLDQSRWDEAESYYMEALQLGRATGDASMTGSFLIELGRIATGRGELERARKLLLDSLAYNLTYVKGCVALEALAELSADEGALDASAMLYGTASALRETGESPLQPHQISAHERSVDALRVLAGDTRFERNWNTGRTMTREQAFEFARTTGPRRR